MKVELKKRTSEESREYLMLQIAGLISDRAVLRASLAEVLKYYMHPNPPHDMLSNAKAALESSK